MVRRISALSVRIAHGRRDSGRDSRSIRSSDRGRVRHDPPEGLRRHAEASRHVNTFDPRELPELRALAADDGDLRPVDLLETQHVCFPSATLPFRPLGPVSSATLDRANPTVDRLVACIVSTSWVLAASPPLGCTLVMAGRTGVVGFDSRASERSSICWRRDSAGDIR